MNTIKERLSALRELMKKQNIDALIVPGTDPHASEYIASCWKDREWISGFNGSAGTVMVAANFAGLWTDSRYFLQAEAQLNDTGITLMKQGLAETPEINSWLMQNLPEGSTCAVNPDMISANGFKKLQNELKEYNIHLKGLDLISSVWTDRPEIPKNSIFIHDKEFTGVSAADKIGSLRRELAALNTDTMILSALDDIAWLYNMRGTDVDYNPVAIAYAMVTKSESFLYIDRAKYNDVDLLMLNAAGIKIREYTEIKKYIENLPLESKILIDGNKLNQSLYESIPTHCTIKDAMSPVFKLKSIKNQVEINGVRNAMERDGVALTRFFMWLEQNLGKTKLTEMGISKKLKEFRTRGDKFYGESFGTICGFAGHGAIVHYSANEESDAAITADNILLLDSGGQYLDGTTDITRTVSLGNTTDAQKTDFTLVLKGHIGIATAIFPSGTRGSQLDILARKAMWDRKLNYGHGTGHGVGHFLNVHEGPQSIRTDENPTVLQVGMIISNEPGMYRTNQYGIRIENLVLVVEKGQSEFGNFYGFESLTLFPIDKNLLDFSILNSEEINWLNEYHKQVYNRLSKALTEPERKWLSAKCASV